MSLKPPRPGGASTEERASFRRRPSSFRWRRRTSYDRGRGLVDVVAAVRRRAEPSVLVDGFLRCLPDAKEAGVIFGTGTRDKGDVYRHPSLKQSYEMGKEI